MNETVLSWRHKSRVVAFICYQYGVASYDEPLGTCLLDIQQFIISLLHSEAVWSMTAKLHDFVYHILKLVHVFTFTRATLYQRGYYRPIIHCDWRTFRYLQKYRYFHLELCLILRINWTVVGQQSWQYRTSSDCWWLVYHSDRQTLSIAQCRRAIAHTGIENSEKGRFSKARGICISCQFMRVT